MKLLLVSHGSGPYGAERVLLELARRLATRGHDVMLALPHAGPAVEQAGGLQGVTVRVCGRRRLPRTVREGFAYFLGGPADAWAVRRLIEDIDPDVVWINSMYNPWAAMGARFARSTVVWQLHERSMRSIPGSLLAMIIGLTADRVVAVSEYAAHSFRVFPWLRRRVDVLYNPLLGEPIPSAARPARPFTIGYVGQLEPRKRATDVIRALSLLPADVRGIFVGGGKGRAALEGTVRAAGVEDRVQLLGYRADAAAQLAQCDCLAIPSLEEAFGLAGLEAMAAGVPVVAARSGALPEVLGDAALYHEPRSPSDLARQVARLRASSELRAELRARGRKRAAGFGPDGWIEAAEALLSQLQPVDLEDRVAFPS